MSKQPIVKVTQMKSDKQKQAIQEVEPTATVMLPLDVEFTVLPSTGKGFTIKLIRKSDGKEAQYPLLPAGGMDMYYFMNGTKRVLVYFFC